MWSVGAPSHEPLRLEQSSDGTVAVYRRVEGPTMWAVVRDRPSEAADFGRALAELHVRLLTTPVPVSLPRQADRLACKLRAATSEHHIDLQDVIAAMPRPSHRHALCHGDFHPGNVIMAAAAPVVVDWFDTCRGDACADIARTSLLLGGGRGHTVALEHLPGHTHAVLRDLHDGYIATIVNELDISVRDVERWRAVEGVARLAEDVEQDSLLTLWRDGAVTPP